MAQIVYTMPGAAMLQEVQTGITPMHLLETAEANIAYDVHGPLPTAGGYLHSEYQRRRNRLFDRPGRPNWLGRAVAALWSAMAGLGMPPGCRLDQVGQRGE